MKTLKPGSCIFLLMTALFFLSSHILPNEPTAIQPLQGAWKLVSKKQQKQDLLGNQEAVKIITGKQFAHTIYQLKEKQFTGSMGGTWQLANGTLTETIEFNTFDAEKVGTILRYSAKLKGNKLTLTSTEGKVVEVWEKIDNGDKHLAGAWRIRERDGQNGEIVTMQRGPRKTIKYMSATRFQWAAFNTETKQFSGTGGGTYTLEDGKYTENIEFFSRDNSRVGASLSFQAKVEGNDWIHQGKSSKGDPIREIWEKED
jgi:hypothetical protein